VTLDECAHCRAASASRFPTDQYLADYYNPANYSSSLVSNVTLSARCAASILKATDFSRDADLHVLDYGGSEGTLSQELRKQIMASGHRGEVQSTVVDIFPRQATDHQRFLDPTAFAADQTKYDLLLASAVLEHLKDVKGAVTSMLAHAAPVAYFYARTPYDVPLSSITSRYKIRYPGHLHDMGPAFWDWFEERLGATVTVLRSEPSIVETTLEQAGARTLAAHALKLPALIENRWLRPAMGYGPRMWHWVGGWEVVYRVDGSSHS